MVPGKVPWQGVRGHLSIGLIHLEFGIGTFWDIAFAFLGLDAFLVLFFCWLDIARVYLTTYIEHSFLIIYTLGFNFLAATSEQFALFDQFNCI
jgi:hypothetical protein